jgi:hypothetical protein
VGIEISITTKEKIWRLLKKLKITLPYYPAMPLLGLYPKEYKSGYFKVTCTLMFLQHYT